MTKTTLNLSDLSFGVMNPIGDTSADNSFDRRRSTLIHYLQKCISDAYAIDTLKKYDKFAGIIIQKEEIPRIITSDPGAKLQQYTNSSNVKDFFKNLLEGDTITAYRVYIPELECRPPPVGQDDPVIGTYQQMLPDPNFYPDYGVFTKTFEIGQVVSVVFGDVFVLSDPRIVDAGEVLHIENFDAAPSSTRGAFEKNPPRRASAAPHSGHASGNPATSPTLCSDAMNGYTPGENAEALRAWIRTTGGKVYEKSKQAGTYDDGPQLDNGGDISSEVVAFIKQAFTEILEEVPTVQKIKISGGNDALHQCETRNSLHRRGLAVDFTLEPATAANVEAVNQIMLEYTAGTSGEVRFKNEYDPSQTTSHTTGDHFHVQIGGRAGASGDRNLDEAQQLQSAGRIRGRTVA